MTKKRASHMKADADVNEVSDQLMKLAIESTQKAAMNTPTKLSTILNDTTWVVAAMLNQESV